MFKNNKAFLNIVMARLIINIADSLFYIISLWYISERSPFLTGIAVFCFTVPEGFLVFFGPLIDRFNPKKLLVGACSLQLIVLSALVICMELQFMNNIILLIMMLLSTSLSVITYPIEETMVPQLVQENELVKANSIIEITYKISDFLFNGISGLLISIFSIGILYKVNLLIFVLPLIILRMIQYKPEQEQRDETFSYHSYKKDLKEGIMALMKRKYIALVIPLVIINFFFSMTAVGMPFFARTFADGEIAYGLFLSVSAIGGFFGVVVVNIIKSFITSGKIITYGLFLQGIFWILMLAANNLYLSLIFLFICYSFFGATNIMLAALFQYMIPRTILGRANAAIDTAIAIAMPIGALLAGYCIEVFDIHWVMALYGIATIGASLVYRKDSEIYETNMETNHCKEYGVE